MNERIRELAEQANTFARETVEYNRCDDFSEFTDRLYTVSREKFAELIVRECANIDFRFKVGMTTDQESDTGRVILEHFDLK